MGLRRRGERVAVEEESARLLELPGREEAGLALAECEAELAVDVGVVVEEEQPHVTVHRVAVDVDVEAERLAVARREAFTGNRLTFGIEARLRLSAYIVAPARDDPALVDIVVVTGIVDLRRYRQHTRWPLPAPLLAKLAERSLMAT